MHEMSLTEGVGRILEDQGRTAGGVAGKPLIDQAKHSYRSALQTGLPKEDRDDCGRRLSILDNNWE